MLNLIYLKNDNCLETKSDAFSYNSGFSFFEYPKETDTNPYILVSTVANHEEDGIQIADSSGNIVVREDDEYMEFTFPNNQVASINKNTEICQNITMEEYREKTKQIQEMTAKALERYGFPALQDTVDIIKHHLFSHGDLISINSIEVQNNATNNPSLVITSKSNTPLFNLLEEVLTEDISYLEEAKNDFSRGEMGYNGSYHDNPYYDKINKYNHAITCAKWICNTMPKSASLNIQTTNETIVRKSGQILPAQHFKNTEFYKAMETLFKAVDTCKLPSLDKRQVYKNISPVIDSNRLSWFVPKIESTTLEKIAEKYIQKLNDKYNSTHKGESQQKKNTQCTQETPDNKDFTQAPIEEVIRTATITANKVPKEPNINETLSQESVTK